MRGRKSCQRQDVCHPKFEINLSSCNVYKSSVMNRSIESILPSYRHYLSVFQGQSDGRHVLATQLESFNQFVEKDIPEIISMANPIVSRGSPEIPLGGPRSALAAATGLSTTAANALLGPATTANVVITPGSVKPINHEYEISLEIEKISIRQPTSYVNN